MRTENMLRIIGLEENVDKAKALVQTALEKVPLSYNLLENY